ncbi:hypothetical protein WME75_38375 [Sorangium sp. So ce1014]|uniref:hypothetical protein n=1 Tax=Sorangium sp. So ce1014 TaxID=3133326 RepID=UPI003F62B6FF
MSLVDDVIARWERRGLVRGRRVVPTFIEDVGSAAAENVRSAALRRWLQTQPANASKWLAKVTGKTRDFAALQVDREIRLDASSRVDLRISALNEAVAFVEAKWAAPPADNQLARYRAILDQSIRSVPLILISPVRHAVGQGVTLPDGILLSDWSALFEHIDGDEAGTVENDLHRTIARWADLRAGLRDTLRSPNTTVRALQELTSWIDNEDGSFGSNLKDYPVLLKQLVLAELAEAFVGAAGGANWRRCLTNRGARGDYQADMAPTSRGDGWFPCADHQGVGVAILLRFHAYPDFQSITLQLGSCVLPYLDGEQRHQWTVQNEHRFQAAFEHAANVRRRLFEAVRRAKLQPRGSPATTEWYKCIYTTSFSNGEHISNILERAAALSQVVQHATATL